MIELNGSFDIDSNSTNTVDDIFSEVLNMSQNNADKTLPKENLDEIMNKTEGVTPIIGDINVTQTTKIDPQTGNKSIETVEKYIKSNKNPDPINYGKGDYTLGDIAKGLYGDKYENHLSGMAETLGINVAENADIGSYKINLNSSKIGNKIGNYLAGNDGYSIDFINSFDGNISGNITSGIRYEADRIAKQTNLKSNLKGFDTDFLEKVTGSFINNKEYKSVMEKLNDGKELTEQEVDIFKKAKSSFGEADNVLRDIATNNNIPVDDLYNASNEANNLINGNATVSVLRSQRDINNYDIIDGRVRRIEQATETPDYLAQAKEYADYTDAKNNFGNASVDSVLKDNTDAFYGNTDAKTLYKLRSAGIETGADEIIDSYAYAKNANLDPTNKVVTNLNSAASEAASKFNISSNNLDYVNNISGLGLSLDTQTGNFSLSEQTLNLMTDEEKKTYKNIIDSKNVGNEDLSDLANSLNMRFRQNEVVNSIEGATSYDNIAYQAKKNYENLSGFKSLSQEYGLDREGVFKASGITNDDLLNEVVNSKKFDELSPEAVKSLYNAKTNLEDAELHLGKLTQQQWVEIFNHNKDGLLRNVDMNSPEQMKQLFGQEIVKYHRLGAGMDVVTRGVDIDTAEGAKNFVNSFFGNDNTEFNIEALEDLFDFKNKDAIATGDGDMGELVKIAMGKGLNKYKQEKQRKLVTEKFGNILDNVVEKYSVSKEFSNSDMIKVQNIAKKVKEQNFTAEELNKLDAVIDRAKDITNDMGKIGMDTAETGGKAINKLKSMKPGKGTVAIGLGIAGIFGIGSMASNAAEERERKRQEMNQLIAAQTASVRGGY